MKRPAANLALAAFGLLAGLLLFEGVLRLAGFGTENTVPDPSVGYRFVPNAKYRWIAEGGSEGRFNSAGWRDVEHRLDKPAGTTRILFLGDSFVEALQVPLDSTFFRRLERGLNRRAGAGRPFEVVALGQNGDGTTAEYVTYELRGARYAPDVVAVLFVLNDPADNYRPAALEKERPFFVEDGDSLRLDTSFNQTADFRKWQRFLWLKSHSVLWTQLHLAVATLRARKKPVPAEVGNQPADGYYRAWNFDRSPPIDSIPAYRITEKILARFARRVQADGHRFVLFASGFARQEDRELLERGRDDPNFDPDKTQRWLTSLGAREGFEVVPLTPAFRQASASGRGPLWYRVGENYGHWNPAGHAVAARAMEDYFERTLPGFTVPAAADSGRAARGAASK